MVVAYYSKWLFENLDRYIYVDLSFMRSLSYVIGITNIKSSGSYVSLLIRVLQVLFAYIASLIINGLFHTKTAPF